ncbi:hypothetical protein [Streptomyces sp. 7N604]|uniref:hypothetical protein n=1 Tax=Streptomyces sp. 7N604 TaxID=3457415 RepID=UPI003FD1E632
MLLALTGPRPRAGERQLLALSTGIFGLVPAQRATWAAHELQTPARVAPGLVLARARAVRPTAGDPRNGFAGKPHRALTITNHMSHRSVLGVKLCQGGAVCTTELRLPAVRRATAGDLR